MKTASIHTPNEQYTYLYPDNKIQPSQNLCQVSERRSPTCGCTYFAKRVRGVTWVKSSMYGSRPASIPHVLQPGPHPAHTHVHAAALDLTRQLRCACGSTQCNATQLRQPAWCRSHARGGCVRSVNVRQGGSLSCKSKCCCCCSPTSARHSMCGLLEPTSGMVENKQAGGKHTLRHGSNPQTL